MSLPTDYTIRRNGPDFEVWHTHLGLLLDGCESYGSAEDHAIEDAAERAARAEAEAADAEHDAIGDFLHACDRGDFAQGLMVGRGADRAESAFLAALREAHRTREALTDRALVSAARRRGASLAEAA